MILSYATSSLSSNNVLSIEEMASYDEWLLLQDYKSSIENEFNSLSSTDYKFAKNDINSLQKFESQIDNFVAMYSSSYDLYVGRYIIDGNEQYKNAFLDKNYFSELKDLYKNWGLTGYKIDSSNLGSNIENSFNDYIHPTDDSQKYTLSNDISLLYECNISGSKEWNDISNLKLDKTEFESIELKEDDNNFLNNRWVWNFSVNTYAVMDTSNYYLPQTYPYDWVINRPALISWCDYNRVISVNTTSSLYVPGVRGSLLEVGSSSKRVGYKNGRWEYTFQSSSYNLYQDYTGSFTPNNYYNSNSSISKYDLYSKYLYLNFGASEGVPVPIIGENKSRISHEDNLYSNRIVEFQSSSVNYRNFQIISSSPFLKLTKSDLGGIPYEFSLKIDGQAVPFVENILHDGKTYDISKNVFQNSEYTSRDIIYKEVQIDFYCRDWELKLNENLELTNIRTL